MNNTLYAQESGIFCRKVNHPHNLLGYAVLLCVFALLSIFILSETALAQERFTVQSTARGMENAKQAAQIRQVQVKDNQQDSRLDAVETDIGKIADHAWKSLAQCGVGAGAGGTDYKISWNHAGTGSWGCIQETDPTVKAFAKTDLPACSVGQVLRADGSKFICTTSAGAAGFEIDPYVQDFARNTAYTISTCAADEILTMTANRLRCVRSRDLSVIETDPTVQPFAKSALPSCAAGQVLTTAVNGSGIGVLRCVTDSDGGYAETDPSVGTITNSKWCMASGGKIHCNQNPPVLAEADPKIGILTNGSWCRATGGKVACDQAEPIVTEIDPKIGQLTNARWCHASGGKIVCDRAQPEGDNLGNHIATENIRLNGKWLSNNGNNKGIFIDTDGRVGIGTTDTTTNYSSNTPSTNYFLSVNGNIQTKGTFSVTDGTIYTDFGRIYGDGSGDGVGGIVFRTGGDAGKWGAIRAYSETTDKPRLKIGQWQDDNGFININLANGRVGIGIVDPERMLHVVGNGLFTGGITASAFNTSSDARLKAGLTPLDSPLQALNHVSAYRYHYKADPEKTQRIGVLAQEVLAVFPEVVSADSDGMLSVDYPALVPVLIEAINRTNSRIDTLQAENDALRKIIGGLERAVLAADDGRL